MYHRETVENYRLTPVQMLGWVAKRAGGGYLYAAVLSFRWWVLCTWQEKRVAFNMQRIFGKKEIAVSLAKSASEKLPYRNEDEIRNLFKRLEIPIEELRVLGSCFVARLGP